MACLYMKKASFIGRQKRFFQLSVLPPQNVERGFALKPHRKGTNMQKSKLSAQSPDLAVSIINVVGELKSGLTEREW